MKSIRRRVSSIFTFHCSILNRNGFYVRGDSETQRREVSNKFVLIKRWFLPSLLRFVRLSIITCTPNAARISFWMYSADSPPRERNSRDSNRGRYLDLRRDFRAAPSFTGWAREEAGRFSPSPFLSLFHALWCCLRVAEMSFESNLS